MNPVTIATQTCTAAGIISGASGAQSIATAATHACSSFSNVASAIPAASAGPISALWKSASSDTMLASAAQPEFELFEGSQENKSTSEATAGIVVITALIACAAIPLAVSVIRNFINSQETEAVPGADEKPVELARHHRTGTSIRPSAGGKAEHDDEKGII